MGVERRRGFHQEPMTRLTLAIDGIRLCAEWRRPLRPDAPALVFLHDGLGSMASLRSFPEALAERTALPAFAYDRYGYGGSDAPERFETYFMEAAAERLEAVLAAAGIPDAVHVGHSDGGTIALLHAARHPARVRAVVSIAAHVRRDRLTLAQMHRHRRMVETGEIPPWMTRFHGARGAHLLDCWTEAWLRPEYDTWDVTDAIRPLAAPLLALQGANDEYGLPDQLAAIAEAVPHAEAELMPGLGHFVHLEDMDGVTGRIAAFLAPLLG